MKRNNITIRSFLPWFLFLLALTARLLPGARTIDDSYITFRYARSILAGQGFVYNPGQAVLGTTTPLYTFIMVILGFLTGGVDAPFPLLAMGFNALADALTCILLWQIGKKLKAELAGVASACVWAVAPYSVTFAIGGLETSLYVLLLTATFMHSCHSVTHQPPCLHRWHWSPVRMRPSWSCRWSCTDCISGSVKKRASLHQPYHVHFARRTVVWFCLVKLRQSFSSFCYG